MFIIIIFGAASLEYLESLNMGILRIMQAVPDALKYTRENQIKVFN